MKVYLPFAFLFFPAPLLAVNADLEKSNTEKVDSTITLQGVVIQDFRVNKHNLVPVSGTIIGRNQIVNTETNSIKELSAVIPNFFMPDYGPRTTAPIYIRGVGIKSDGTAAAFYVDGVPYYEPITFETDLSDIASIEVLRGPQGTLFGRNSLGGLINIHTLTPFDWQGTKINVGYGNYNDFRTSGSASYLLSKTFGLTAGATYHHAGGYFKNKYDGKHTDQMDETEEHVGFFWHPAERWALSLTSRLAYSDQGGYSYSPYDTDAKTLSDIDYNRPSGFRRLVSTSALAAEYTGKGFTLSSHTSYQYLKSHQYVDQDYTEADKTYLLGDRHQSVVSEELTAKSNTDSRYQWVTGVFGMYEHTKRATNNNKPSTESGSLAFYHEPTSSFAIYHQSSYNVWRGLSLAAGLRFDYEHTHSRYTRFSYSEKTGTTKQTNDFDKTLDSRQLTPKFAVQYLTTAGNKYYATVSRGYKAGGFNRSIASEDEQKYDPEYSWNYEVGTHLNLIGDKLTLDADLYYIDWKHMQLTYTYVGIGTITTNAGHADSKGAELSLNARPVQGLDLSLNYGYTYARFLSYHKSDKLDYTGNRLPMVPQSTLGFNANYTKEHLGWLDKLMVNFNVNALGKIYWAEDNVVKQPFYAVANAKVAFTKSLFTWSVWAKNLTSTDYLANVMTVSTGTYAQKGKPFTIGTTLSVEF